MDYTNDNILDGLTPDINNPEFSSKQELSVLREALQEELRKANKKLKRAKKKGKGCKKLKKKIKKLEKEIKKQKRKNNKPMSSHHTKRQPTKGRWDVLIEKSVPEMIKFATIIVDRKLPQKNGDNDEQAKRK
jgi:hypothetical protein